jgi:hypothetical protein
MPETFLEESIVGQVTASIEDGTLGAVGILQKRINLPRGNKFQLLTADVFDDNGSVGIAYATPDLPSAVAYYISPYPISLSLMDWGNQDPVNQRAGPPAGDDNVLFKKLGINQKEPDGTKWIWSQYPSPQIAAHPGKSWYSPHLYVTAVYWGLELDKVNFQFSVSLHLKVTNASTLMASLNNYKEFNNAQNEQLTDTAVNIPLNQWTGQTYPMWTYGGIRPEIVMKATDLLTYYHDSELLNPETAQTRAALEAQFLDSQSMVAFDQPFGEKTLNFPSWLHINASGIAAGPIRKQWPPNKYADNGNTLTF